MKKPKENLICPTCKKSLENIKFYGMTAGYCFSCFGTWFKEDQLRKAKDLKDENLNWLDIDLWERETDFQISKSQKVCPSCGAPLYETIYGNSNIEVDVCNLCKGIWLDRGEFRKIINYLKTKANYEILHSYAKNLIEETKEIFTGPEPIRSEIADFLTLVKLFKYKFISRYPTLTKLFLNLPK